MLVQSASLPEIACGEYFIVGHFNYQGLSRKMRPRVFCRVAAREICLNYHTCYGYVVKNVGTPVVLFPLLICGFPY